MRTRLHTLVGAALAVTLAVSVAPAIAGKDGNGNGGNGNGNGNGNNVTQSSSISLSRSGQTLAFGDSVTFASTVVGLNGTEYPLVYVECRSAVDGSLLYGQLDHPDATSSSEEDPHVGGASATTHIAWGICTRTGARIAALT